MRLDGAVPVGPRPDGILYFASLQGTTAVALQTDRDDFSRDLDTFVLAEPGPAGVHLVSRTDGLVRALELAGGAPGWARLLKLVPRVVRDAAYRLFAPARHHLFGRKDVCALPTPEGRSRLLP